MRNGPFKYAVAPPLAALRLLKRLAKNSRGAAAVEFALIMVPLFALILASLQTAIIFFVGQTLQSVAEQVGRTVMTGAVQDAGLTKTQFIANVTSACKKATILVCGNVMVDVQSASSFSAVDTTGLAPTYSKSGTPSFTGTYSPGNPGDIVILRLMYDWPVFGGPLGIGLVNQPNGTHLLVGTTVFKNEPYQ
jgi:Flp pilus assembly protein TadG